MYIWLRFPGRGKWTKCTIILFLKLCCDQTVWFFQVFSTCAKVSDDMIMICSTIISQTYNSGSRLPHCNLSLDQHPSWTYKVNPFRDPPLQISPDWPPLESLLESYLFRQIPIPRGGGHWDNILIAVYACLSFSRAKLDTAQNFYQLGIKAKLGPI